MLTVASSNRFEKDLKRIKKRGMNLDKLEKIIDLLSDQKSLPKVCKDHQLIGNFNNRRECHINPDWLLIYKIDHSQKTLFLERTGSHSDLF